ncbi:MAG: ABC transporter ATP-binding protein [Deltaproteobacteria bacterium]
MINNADMAILKIENVVKRFQSKTAVDGISMKIEKGKIYGLLGPNGAGKTTLIRMVTRILHADEGKIYLNDEELNDLHPALIGYMPEERGLYKKMKVGEQLLYLAQLRGMSYSTARNSLIDWMTRFEMKDWWNKKVDELSKGMQQKVQFVSTILHNPELIVLDEPFTGLDPVNTELIKKEIINLKDKGTTIIFSTHRMEQVEEICEEIALIHQGKVILQGNVTDIRNTYKENKYVLKLNKGPEADIPSEFQLISQDGMNMIIKLNENQNSTELLKFFIDNNAEISSFNESLPSLNEIFIKLVTEK